MKGMGKMKRLLAMLLCVMQIFGCIPHLDAHGDVHAHTHAYAEECAHANATAEYTGTLVHASGAVYEDDKNGKTHSILGYRQMKYTCPDCSEVWYEDEETAQKVSRSHYFDVHGICTTCGAENSCTHQDGDPESWTYYQLADGAQWTANNDGMTHSALAYAAEESYCDLCNTYFIMSHDETPQVYSENHDYNSEGVCYACGYENTCEHPEEYFNSWFYFSLADGAQWTANDDGKNHSALAYKITRGRCDLCKMYFDISRDETPHVYTEEHYYEDGVCQSCGAENSCEHPESYISTWYGYELDAGEKWTANKDGKTHSAKAIKRVGIFCELCGMDLEVTEDESPVLYTVEHDYFNSNICDDCGYENSCEHPIAYLNIWTDYELIDDAEWTINNDGTHTGNCYEFTVTNCNLCGQYTRTRGEAKVRTLPHEFYRNICQYCGVLNSCTHPNATTYTQVEYHTDLAADNGLTHTGIGTLYESGWCADCQSNLNKTVLDNNYSLTEQHYMTNGICDVCGYKTLCDHPTTDVFGSFRNGRNYTQKNETYHTGVYDYYETTYCTVCESNLTTQLVEANKTYDSTHVFLDDGTCFNCGYLNTCTHDGEPATYTAYYDYSSNVTFTEATHSYTATKYYELYCDVCGTVLEYTETPNTTVTEEHKFNTSGVCIICGYGSDSVCTHENAEHTGGNQKNQTVVINENGTHTRTFDVYWEYTCLDCGEEFETFIEQGSETEPHVAGGKPNVCVVCGSAMCERHFYRDGKCIRCGYENACTHENAIFEEDGRNENTVIVDNKDGTHTRTFDVYLYYACPDCEESCAIYEEQGVETEPHEYPNSVSCQCGKLKPCNTHDWSNLDGECRVCGTACEHGLMISTADTRYCHYCGYTQYHDWSDKSGFCTICGFACDNIGHIYENSICTKCGYSCIHYYWDRESGTCATCGMICKHEETYIDEDEEIISEITAVNGLYHSWRENQFEELTCSICWKVLGTTIIKENVERTLYHDTFYNTGSCNSCGYEFLCDHTNVEVEYKYDQAGPITEVDENSHQGEFVLVSKNRCTDCGILLNYTETIEFTNTIQPHEYINGICRQCDRVNTCTHDADTYEKLTPYAPYDMVCIDETNHSYKSLMKVDTYCSLCNEKLDSVRDVVNTFTEPHSRNSEGVCVVCLDSTDLSCTHENAEHTGGNQKNQTVVINENGTHTRTFDVYWEYICLDCGEEFETFIEQGSETEAHVAGSNPTLCHICGSAMCEYHYYRDGVCSTCGYACAHDGETFASSEGDIISEIKAVNGLYHAWRENQYKDIYCSTCFKFIDTIPGEENVEETEYHIVSDDSGICSKCGYEFLCEHTNTELEYRYLIYSTAYPVDAYTHQGEGMCTKIARCTDCSLKLGYSQTNEYKNLTLPHEFEDGICYKCDYVSTCTHNADTYEKLRAIASRDMTCVDENNHSYQTYAVADIYCSLCNSMIDSGKGRTFTTTEPHSRNSEGVCVVCLDSTDLSCTHENAEHTGGNQKNQTVVINENGTHTRTFDVYWEYTCLDCGEEFETFIEQGSETEPHVAGGKPNVCVVCDSAMCSRHFYRDGKCIRCGYENACTHENAIFEEDGRNENTVIVDNKDGTHTRTFDVYLYYACPDCEESCAIYEEQGVETEPHEYPNGVSCQCGKLKPCEVHDWTDGFGVCNICGENCMHPQDSLLYSTYYELADDQEWIADDNGITHTAMAVKVVRKYCSNCFLETEDYRDVTAQLYSVDHSFMSDGYCYYCGYACLHENKTQIGGEQQNMVIGDIGNGKHIRAFDVYWIYDCPDCNVTLKKYIERGYEIESHTYFGNSEYCDTCDAAQNCSHIQSGSMLDYEMIFGTPQPHNEEFHLQPYTTYLRYQCASCGGSFMKSNEMEGLEGHQFGEDGFCVCGAQGEPMTCQHENIEFRYCEENVVYSDVTDQQHTKTYDLYFYTWCLDCETRRVYQLEAPNQTTTEVHDFTNGACPCGQAPAIPECDRHYYLDGICIECGHENLCAHTNAVFAEDGRQKNTVTINNGNGTHTRTFDVYHFYDCPDCEESYAIFMEQGSETEPHVAGGNPNLCIVCDSAMCSRHFYRDGKCIRCGYENDCTHENAIFEEDGRNENTVIVDNKDGTHTRTFDVYLYYACPDCEESCAIYEEQGVETEPHEYPNGVSCQCGKRKPCDAHNFVSGECTACGQQAMEGMEHVITLPSALKTIETEAFAGSAADAFIVPNGCTTIGERAFAQCDSLKCIILPGSVTEIADNAFDGCENVTILAPQGSAAHALADELNFTWYNAQ